MKASKKKGKGLPHASLTRPGNKEARYGIDPDVSLEMRPLWSIEKLDFGCKWSCLDNWLSCLCDEIIPKLKDFETMTWQQIISASGGRRYGTNNHPIPVNELIKEARDRLAELRLDDYDELFSLRLTSRKRIWGIRDGCVFRILWFDPYHAVCPVNN